MTNHVLIVTLLAGCNLGPRVPDAPDAAPPVIVDAAPDQPAGFTDVLPADAVVPSVADNAELLLQIRINDGLNDATLASNGGVVVRGTGKSNGATVRFWNFGPVASETGNIAVLGPVFVFGTLDDNNVFTPLADHPQLIDTLPGDVRYSPIRRVTNVPVTPLYAGEKITSLAALTEAIDKGLVGDPVPDGTWINLPVVLPGTMLEVGATSAPMPARQVYSHGYLVDVFELGTSLGRQPLKFGQVPTGQASGLQSGVATGTPPTKSTAIDPQPVFQFAIPTAPPGTTFSYSPLAFDVTVRLADGVAPSAITSDANLFKRSGTGAITAYFTDTVETFTVGTTLSNLQLQFAEDAP